MILLRFIADEETIKLMVEQRGFIRDDEKLEYREEDDGEWRKLWGRLSN